MTMEHSVPKRLHIKFRRRGIAQKKEYNIQNTAKVWNEKQLSDTCVPPTRFDLCKVIIREVYSKAYKYRKLCLKCPRVLLYTRTR